MDGSLTRGSWVCPEMDQPLELRGRPPVAARFSQEL